MCLQQRCLVKSAQAGEKDNNVKEIDKARWLLKTSLVLARSFDGSLRAGRLAGRRSARSSMQEFRISTSDSEI